jgi:hypothetical protein
MQHRTGNSVPIGLKIQYTIYKHIKYEYSQRLKAIQNFGNDQRLKISQNKKDECNRQLLLILYMPIHTSCAIARMYVFLNFPVQILHPVSYINVIVSKTSYRTNSGCFKTW